MDFKTHNDVDVDISGTSLMSCIDVSYQELKKVFGQPIVYKMSGEKTDAEWHILFSDGAVATIYDYKTGINYEGKHGIPKSKNTNWHIGGFEERVVSLIKSKLKL